MSRIVRHEIVLSDLGAWFSGAIQVDCQPMMSAEIIAVAGLIFAIHLIATLSYSVRIVGVRTGRIAVSFALFNVLILASRMANTRAI